ncbi:hypothetical protein HZA96_01590 [Candidatus Woesearchaeota archaeon]|nr:hypothetical protein [Candidatus Woesearchaeota archaeon]
MNTTIAVKSETLDLLKHMKDEIAVTTYDEVIKKLVLHMKKPKQSLFGSLKEIRSEFEREKSDRFD